MHGGFQNDPIAKCCLVRDKSVSLIFVLEHKNSGNYPFLLINFLIKLTKEEKININAFGFRNESLPTRFEVIATKQPCIHHRSFPTFQCPLGPFNMKMKQNY